MPDVSVARDRFRPLSLLQEGDCHNHVATAHQVKLKHVRKEVLDKKINLLSKLPCNPESLIMDSKTFANKAEAAATLAGKELFE